jgi:hypothetical protein
MEILLFHERKEFIAGQRIAVKEPLDTVAAILYEEIGLRSGFDTFGDGFLAEFVRHFYDCPANIFGVSAAAD